MTSILSDAARAALTADLQALLGDRSTMNPTQLEHHSHGESWHAPGLPDVVVFPLSTDEVAAIVTVAQRHRAPVVPFGVGSSLEGHVNAIRGGVSIDLSRMNRILRVSAEDLDCQVEAGVTHRQLNKALSNSGLQFWVDPGADATLGGMAATRASGTTAVRYGTMREAVLGLTVVLADGSVIRTGGRARKSSAGYDLTRLFVGSEGTLGVITELTLRLHGLPEAVSAAVCPFESMEGAVNTVMTTIQLGHPGCADRAARRSADRRRQSILAPELPVEADAVLRIPRHEHRGGRRTCARGSRKSPANRARPASSGRPRQKIGRGCGRRVTTPFTRRSRFAPAASRWTTDVCVPISKFAECVLETRRDVQASRLVAPLIGHAGDGNFHLIFVIDPDDAAELEAASQINARLVHRALAMGGTCTGEHGVGHRKDGLSAGGARRRARGHENDQARARPGEPDEPG